jgi:Protein of unknown function (DUF1254)
MITPGPSNSFSQASRLAGPDDRFVSINNDTIYSIAQVDVSGSPANLEAVRALQRELALEPVGTPAQAEGVPAQAEGVPAQAEGVPAQAEDVPAPAAVPAELAFFEQLRTWMQAFPPPAAGCGATTGMRRSTRRLTRMPTATSSTGITGTPSGSARTRPSTRSGPSPCTTCPTSTWSPTRSTGTPSATAPRPAPRQRRVTDNRDPAPAARRHQQLAARPRRAVPAAHAPVPAAGRHPGRHLPDPAYHQGRERGHRPERVRLSALL